MSILIKGMEMPTSCDECPMFNLDIDGGCYCTKYFVIRKKDQDRPDWCPLVPVPPHVRLGDLNALKFSPSEFWGFQATDNAKSAEAIVNDAPTFIPASEES